MSPLARRPIPPRFRHRCSPTGSQRCAPQAHLIHDARRQHRTHAAVTAEEDAGSPPPLFPRHAAYSRHRLSRRPLQIPAGADAPAARFGFTSVIIYIRAADAIYAERPFAAPRIHSRVMASARHSHFAFGAARMPKLACHNTAAISTYWA